MPERKNIKNEPVENRDTFPSTSRYRGIRYFTREHAGIGTFTEQETWQPPTLTIDETDKFTDVMAGEEGRLDLISLRVYRISALWWVIALSNKIIDPFTEVTVGRSLRYPRFDRLSTQILA